MPERHLTEELIEALISLPIWPNVVADSELCPEIRGGTVTIYYSGCGILRNLRLQDGRVTGSINVAHVPLTAEGRRDLRLTWNSDLGFQFADTPIAVPLGWGEADVLNAYKAAAQIRPEQRLLGAVLRHDNNQGLVLDQEIAFSGRTERIDLCYFDIRLQRLTFLELKRADDSRLLSRRGEPPEVLEQLRRYADCLRDEEQKVLRNFRQCLDLKRQRLGLRARIARIPQSGDLQLCTRPILAIGGCDDTLVRELLCGEGCWKPLMDGLPQVAAGLYLCGDKGFALGGTGNHMRAWNN